MMCGLEIHVQLETESKLFCDCPTNFNEAPINQNICPVCLNQPGAKPHPTNQHAIENALMISSLVCINFVLFLYYFNTFDNNFAFFFNKVYHFCMKLNRQSYLNTKRDAWVEINLDAIEHNILELKKYDDIKIAEIIKPTEVANPAPAIPIFKYFMKTTSKATFKTFAIRYAQNCNLINP